MTYPDVSIRPVTPGDLPMLFEFHQDPESVRMAAFVRGDPADHGAFNAHWEKILGMDTVIARTILLGAEVVGSVAKFEMDDQPEITYWIAREHWGKGIATRALTLVLQEVTVRPMRGRAAADNLASIRVLENCGFERIGTELAHAEARGTEIEEAVLILR